MSVPEYQHSLEWRLGETLEKEKRNQSIISQLRQRIRELEKALKRIAYEERTAAEAEKKSYYRICQDIAVQALKKK